MTEPEVRKIDQRLQALLLQGPVHERKSLACKAVVEDHTPDRRVDGLRDVLLDPSAHHVLHVVLAGQID